MKKLTIGLLAHVDAGKTTLAESLLYTAGDIRAQGRVDRGSTVMDTHDLEKRRGITIFTGESSFMWKDAKIQLLDTPGHVDFSAEAERSLRALDLAIIVISGLDGVQAHTLTLWKLLAHYEIPVAFFVTKMDFARIPESELLDNLHHHFGSDVIRFDTGYTTIYEAIALTSEALLEQYAKSGTIADSVLAELIFGRRIFPCFFGSGLKNEGVEELLDFLARFGKSPRTDLSASAYVYKISYDKNDNRITHAKLLTGLWKVKQSLRYEDEQGTVLDEKFNILSFPKGEKVQQADLAEAGDLVCVQGLSHTYCGQTLTEESLSVSPRNPLLEPVMSYHILLPDGEDPKMVFPKLIKLCEEDPALHLRIDETGAIRIDLMGFIQTEVLKSIAESRFGLRLDVEEGQVLYKETITDTVEGVGHYEPLRHYAEVHVIMEPAPRGEGLSFVSEIPEDDLAKHWQRLILTHLKERTHKGVLLGAPVTDIRFRLVRAAAHEKHTEGGDFRQATYRAVRQGLRQAKSLLLEPYYAFRLELPAEQIGRAISDLRLRHAEMDAPDQEGNIGILTGRAPVVCLNGYARELNGYTGGRGRLCLEADGYAPCHNAEEIIAQGAYNPDGDTDHTADSVFCSHGAGRIVPWNEVKNYMHLPSALIAAKESHNAHQTTSLDDEALEELMLREFGPIKRPMYTAEERSLYEHDDPVHIEAYKDTVFVIDGYNLLFSTDALRPGQDGDLEYRRDLLLKLLADYQGFSGNRVIIVFDGYRRQGNLGEKSDYCNVKIVFTKEHETADAYIERFVTELGPEKRVRVVSSDALVQLGVLRAGVLRMSSREFYAELLRVLADLKKYIEKSQK